MYDKWGNPTFSTSQQSKECNISSFLPFLEPTKKCKMYTPLHTMDILSELFLMFKEDLLHIPPVKQVGLEIGIDYYCLLLFSSSYSALDLLSLGRSDFPRMYVHMPNLITLSNSVPWLLELFRAECNVSLQINDDCCIKNSLFMLVKTEGQW